MNLKEMSKEQKQVLVLGVLVGCTSLFALVQFVLLPAKSKWTTARTELTQLRTDLHNAEKMIQSEQHLIETRAESDRSLALAVREYLPANDNPLSWATQKLYGQAREVGVELQSISETGPSPVLRAQVEKAHRTFSSYAVRLVADCSFEKVKTFIDALESDNPYITITGVSIDAKADRPQHHGVIINVEWPMPLQDIHSTTPELGDQHG